MMDAASPGPRSMQLVAPGNIDRRRTKVLPTLMGNLGPSAPLAGYVLFLFKWDGIAGSILVSILLSLLLLYACSH
jgi:hypothetical protein